jgi:hypothetical protein
MGVTGLWPVFSEASLGATVTASLADALHGRVTGVDTSVWMHAIGRAYAEGVMLARDYAAAVARVVSQANELTLGGATLVFVFDNRREPYAPKQAVDAKRAASSDAKWVAYQAGVGTPGASQLLAKAFRVTPEFQDAVFAALQSAGFTCVLSGREADHQLAALYHEGSVDQVMSLDGDNVSHSLCGAYHSELGLCRWYLRCVFVGQTVGRARHMLGRLKRAARYELLRSFALLAGCDYGKLDGIAIVSVKKLISDAALRVERGDLVLSALHGFLATELPAPALRSTAHTHGFNLARAISRTIAARFPLRNTRHGWPP